MLLVVLERNADDLRERDNSETSFAIRSNKESPSLMKRKQKDLVTCPTVWSPNRTGLELCCQVRKNWAITKSDIKGVPLEIPGGCQ